MYYSTMQLLAHTQADSVASNAVRSVFLKQLLSHFYAQKCSFYFGTNTTVYRDTSICTCKHTKEITPTL